MSFSGRSRLHESVWMTLNSSRMSRVYSVYRFIFENGRNKMGEKGWFSEVSVSNFPGSSLLSKSQLLIHPYPYTYVFIVMKSYGINQY